MKFYFDNAATTFPKPECVVASMTKCLNEGAINAGRGSYDLAFEADRVISRTREQVKSLLGFDGGRVMFSPSATIALNQVLLGLAWKHGDIVYSTPYEHNAVARVLNHLVTKQGIEWGKLPFDIQSMTFSMEDIKQQFFRHPPKALVLSHASNVFGVVTPVEEIAAIASQYGAVVIVDGAQVGPLLPSQSSTAIDFYVFSGHKTFYGPFGIAGFWTNERFELLSILFGGTGSHSESLDLPAEYPFSIEVGSPNIVAITGLQAACDWLDKTGPEKILKHERLLMKCFIDGVKDIRGIRSWPQNNEKKSVGIASFAVDGYTPQEVGMIFDQQFGMAVRTGLHCAPMAHECLGTLPRGTVRVGFGWFNREDEVDALIGAIGSLTE